jgi:phosphoribosylformimino-5-aminoimidazole carboxamide ribotide isomerase
VDTVILFPAIDLKDGECVRLIHGDMTQATIFNHNPTHQALEFEQQGFEYLHVVDLDGAFAGKPINGDAVSDILKNIKMPVQLGGGIRDMRTIEFWIEKGISRVIIGTAAVRDPELVKEAARLFPNKIAVGIDAKHGLVAVEGWAKLSQITAVELAKTFEAVGVAAIIYTDIARDGVLKGLNIEATLELAKSVSIPVIASGGLASLDDIKRILQPDCSALAGAITGRALYDGRLNPSEALALIKKHRVQNNA